MLQIKITSSILKVIFLVLVSLLLLILLRISLANDNFLLLLGSSLCMFAQLLLFLNNEVWSLLTNLLLNRFNRLFASKVFTPSFFCHWRFLGGIIGVTFTISYKVCMLLSLLIHQILILWLIYLLRSLLMCFWHFLSHYLRKHTIASRGSP